MSRFDDEGAPLITRSVTDRWRLPVANIQRILRLQPLILKSRWEEQPRRRPSKPSTPEPEDTEPPETYDEHGELHNAHPEKPPPSPHLDLKG